jgi:hypothetical protein
VEGWRTQFKKKCPRDELLPTYIVKIKVIWNHRYRKKKASKGSYLESYVDILKWMNSLNLKRFFIYEEDIKNNLYVSFIVKDGKYDLPKNIDIIYFDGTFKAKLDPVLHYNILFFATLSKEIHKLVHLGFVISFSSTYAEYMNIWKGIEKYYTNCGYSFQNTCFMSDVGPSELKFSNLYNEIFHFWC